MSALENNLAELEQHLARFRDAPLGHFIAGEADAGRSGSHLDNLTPIDNSVIGQVAAGDAADIDAAAR
ncbi:MAG: 5-carboxymethyl-2-hydroxymuconate semialdehyde dehydrogenase, partial [Gammaproteobacteria bacterium]